MAATAGAGGTTAIGRTITMSPDAGGKMILTATETAIGGTGIGTTIGTTGVTTGGAGIDYWSQ